MATVTVRDKINNFNPDESVSIGETNIKKIRDGKKNEEKPGDLKSPISAISKTSFF
jgi:hypothetical protein